MQAVQTLERRYLSAQFISGGVSMLIRSALLALVVSTTVHAAPFTAGDIVIYRVGDGAASLTSAAQKVFLDEYNPSGTLVQSLLLPTSPSGLNGMLTASGTATSEGMLTLSSNGQFLVLTGYNAVLGTAGVASTASATVARTVGLVNVSTGITDTSTTLNSFSGNNIRSAASSNGSDIWVAGANGGIGYTTIGNHAVTAVSTTIANNRQVAIFSGQLYSSDSSGSAVRVGNVGTGLPTTSGQTITNLPGFATSGSPYSFFMADLDGVAGVDTLYVADDAVGISKYSLFSGSWVSKGTVGLATDAYRGLAGAVSGNSVTLFATRKGGTSGAGGGELAVFTDSAGYNATISAVTPTLLATAANNTAFRGVALISAVPEPETWAMLLAGLGLLGFAKRRRA
jgi:hypothetical protein